MRDRAACGFHHDWNTIRQAAIARLLIEKSVGAGHHGKSRLSGAEIRQGYRQNVWPDRPKRSIIHPAALCGLDFPSSFTGTNFWWYPFEHYDYEGLWPPAYPPGNR
ncbi:MAG: hypothetical protein U1E41_04955 [Paracoccus sp. (in: a-proteobacteria)]